MVFIKFNNFLFDYFGIILYKSIINYFSPIYFWISIFFPNAKINIGLNITSKRSDNYHNLESVFYPIDWQDILEIVPSNKMIFETSGISIPGKPICV